MYDCFVLLYPHTAYIEQLEQKLLANRSGIDLLKIGRYFRRQVLKARSLAKKTSLIVVNKEGGEPNELSQFACHREDDIIISTDVTGVGMDAPTRNSDYEWLAPQIPGDHLLLGGFHLYDCIFQLGIELLGLDQRVDIAMLTTDFLYDVLSLPDYTPRRIGRLSHPINFFEWLHHFGEHLSRAWEAELGTLPLA